jgi:uncharacterized protein YbaA (DUF1428 family)
MYVDGFIVPVPKDSLDDYEAMATLGRTIWMEHGALGYVECIADDVPYGELTSFPRAVQQQEGETVIFAWITYRDRAHRDEVNAKVMADERMPHSMENMPFDGKRMIWGGFKALVVAT